MTKAVGNIISNYSLSLSEGHLSAVPVRSDAGGGSFPAGHEEGPSVGADRHDGAV